MRARTTWVVACLFSVAGLVVSCVLLGGANDANDGAWTAVWDQNQTLLEYDLVHEARAGVNGRATASD